MPLATRLSRKLLLAGSSRFIRSGPLRYQQVTGLISGRSIESLIICWAECGMDHHQLVVTITDRASSTAGIMSARSARREGRNQGPVSRCRAGALGPGAAGHRGRARQLPEAGMTTASALPVLYIVEAPAALRVGLAVDELALDEHGQDAPGAERCP